MGFLTARGLKIKEATALQEDIRGLLETQATEAYALFNQYPVNSTAQNSEEKSSNLEALRQGSPGSLVNQTVRLGRVIFDAMGELYDNRPLRMRLSQEQQTEYFCPTEPFVAMLKAITKKQFQAWGKRFSALEVINQTTFQLSWLIGYYAHLDKLPPQDYLKYGSPCIPLYIEYGDRFIKSKKI